MYAITTSTHLPHEGILDKPTYHRRHNFLAFHMPKALKHNHVSLAAPINCITSKLVASNARTSACMTTARISANYKPTFWSFDYIQSLRTEYGESKHLERTSKLVQQVKMLLDEERETGRQLELIDALQRLGVSHHFLIEIQHVLEYLYNQRDYKHYNAEKRPLQYTALEFRLLRQHGFSVPQEVFDYYKNEQGDFDPSLCDDVEGLLQLYEASFLLTPGEQNLELGMKFATISLEEKLRHDSLSVDESILVRHALELPIHWRAQRPDVKWFIHAYGQKPGMNPLLLQLSKLDFNIVQAMHRRELQHVSRWWKETGLAEALPFARDRVVENYFWTIGGLFHPELKHARIQITKVNAFIVIIDDIFDVYGTTEELHLFNEVVQGWNIEAMEKLPDYMKMCFLALNNFINEMAYDVMKEKGHHPIISYLRKSWKDLIGSFLQEAKWFAAGYTPTIEEYMSNAWISGSATAILSHAYFLIANPIEKEAIEDVYKYHNIIKYSSTILRLANDVATSSDEMGRGDVVKSVACYMKERGVGREEAEKQVRAMIGETWKRMNEEVRAMTLGKGRSVFPAEFVRWAMDVGRMAQYLYQHGDGYGHQTHDSKNRISTLLFHPIALLDVEEGIDNVTLQKEVFNTQ